VTDTGEPALIDPAVYQGHREAELAFTELFGGFP
jgi:fructosamine-3-kinase